MEPFDPFTYIGIYEAWRHTIIKAAANRKICSDQIMHFPEGERLRFSARTKRLAKVRTEGSYLSTTIVGSRWIQ
jgi:hypothetical protein